MVHIFSLDGSQNVGYGVVLFFIVCVSVWVLRSFCAVNPCILTKLCTVGCCDFVFFLHILLDPHPILGPYGPYRPDYGSKNFFGSHISAAILGP